MIRARPKLQFLHSVRYGRAGSATGCMGRRSACEMGARRCGTKLLPDMLATVADEENMRAGSL
jgi:hypothetical protein